jgi:hypothetical protein
MDNWIAAFKAIGGFTAIGGLIDYMMYTAEKDKLKALLEDWWLRFTYVKWSNFGRAEAALAVQILDRWAGPRLWSWKRWRLSTVVTLLVVMFTLTWTLVRIVNDVNFGDTVVNLVSAQLILVPQSIVALALSLSLTRFIAVGAAHLCKGPLASVTVFTALLSLHVFLLFYWSAIVLFLEFVGAVVVLELVGPVLGFTSIPVIAMPSVDKLLQLFGDFLQERLPKLGELPEGWRYLFSFHPKGSYLDLSMYSFKTAMDFVANGLRIVLALVFLSSFVFRPLIQEPITRLWYGAMNSKKPAFTILFGAVGTLIAAGQALVK